MTTTGIKWRIGVVLTLALAPVVFLVCVGFYHLWDRGWSFWAWIPMAVCFIAAYSLGWYWTRRRRVVNTAEGTDPPPEYWTARDRAAWELVEVHAAATAKLTPDQMADFDRYAHDAKNLALKVARAYHPNTNDPFGHLTIPEVMTCGELVSQDMAVLVQKYVPLSHVMTVNDWNKARKVADMAAVWYPRLRNLYWLGAAVFSPVQTAVQAAVTRGGMTPMFAQVQRNVMTWLHDAYIRKLGRYLIELNSGRLRVGAKRYRELLEQHLVPPNAPDGVNVSEPPEGMTEAQPEAPPPGSPPPTAGPQPVTVAIVGPVKAGKSSLVNALLGEQKAATDVVPLTPGATTYVLNVPGQPTLTLMDSAGYGNDGPSDKDLDAALAVAREADILILATPARSAARAPEVKFLKQLRERFDALPRLKMPPVVVSLSQIDLLSPAVDWTPPYDWKAGDRPKEKSVRSAIEAARDQFGETALAIVPVCTAPGKVLGVRDDLLGTIAGVLSEGRGVGLLRILHAEASADQARRAVGQVLNVGKQLFRAVWESSGKDSR